MRHTSIVSVPLFLCLLPICPKFRIRNLLNFIPKFRDSSISGTYSYFDFQNNVLFLQSKIVGEPAILFKNLEYSGC